MTHLFRFRVSVLVLACVLGLAPAASLAANATARPVPAVAEEPRKTAEAPKPGPGAASSDAPQPAESAPAASVPAPEAPAAASVPAPAPAPASAPEAPKAQPRPQPKPEPDEQEASTLQTLLSIRETLEEIQGELTAKRQALTKAKGEEQKAALTAEVAALTDRMASLDRSFESIATGVEPEHFAPKRQEKLDWAAELEIILGPILQELKSMTERPREIERLRGQVEILKARVPVIRAAKAKLERMLEVNRDRTLNRQLEASRKVWESREQQVGGELSVAEYQLAEKLKERTSVVESLQNLAKNFFKSRGRNLILSLLAFVSVFLALNLSLRGVRRISPLHKGGRSTFASRLFEILYHAMTVTGATVAGLAVLYATGDWVLLGIALIFLFGVAWTAKQSLARFWEQCKLLLDLGTVREGERIIHNGLPFKVASLNVYTSLVNPALRGGRVRLPLQSLLGMNSRPHDPDEPWFPSREGDWVLLPDNVFGRVACQTPEVVQIVLPGGSRRSYPAAKFLEMGPTNLSTGFRARTVIGLDYSLQDRVAAEIPALLQAFVREGLEREGLAAHLHDVSAALATAGASSLDLVVLADFGGQAASRYMAIGGIMQRLCVEACTLHGWPIPFPQLTVHGVRA